MTIEVTSLAECFLALIADERFLASMYPRVINQHSFLTELLVTLGARKRFRTGVNAIMPFQVERGHGSFPANITMEAINAVLAPHVKRESGFL